MCCILCLEAEVTTEPPTVHISIYTPEAEQLQMENIIAKHFWLQPDATSPNKRAICRCCWDAVYAFHQFYLRVERAQEQLSQLQQPLDDPLVAQFDSKLEVDEEDAEACKSEELPSMFSGKRRRGRPRKESVSTLSEKRMRQPARKCAAGLAPPKKFKKTEEQLVELLVEAKLEEQEVDMSIIKDELNAGELECFADGDDDDDAYADKEDDIKPAQTSDSEDAAPSEESRKKAPRRFQSNAKKSLVMLKSDEFISASNFRLICALCPYNSSSSESQLPDFTALMRHFREQHRTRGYVLCCGKKLFKRGLLCDHIHVHQDPAYFRCPRCAKVLADRRCLENHLRCAHEEAAAVPKRERSHQCRECGKGFHSRALLASHSLTHWPAEQKTVACLQCEKTFATEQVMNQHLRLVHLRVYAKICDTCGKSIGGGNEALRRHQAAEHAETAIDGFVATGPLKCELCGLSLSSKHGLARHIKVMHSEEHRTPQVCSICSKISPSVSAHQSHVKYAHRLERKHTCPMCPKAFKRAGELKEHMTTHTGGQALYTCPHCPKTFNSNANMHSHRKKMHRPEWEELRRQKYNNQQKETNTFATEQVMNQHLRLVHLRVYAKICDTCGKSIGGGNEALRRHQAAEHAETAIDGFVATGPLKCELCGLSLSSKHGLARHIKVMHSEEHRTPQVCSICSKISPSVSAHQSHVKYAHRLERKHTCPMCPKAFKRAGELKEHMTTHTGGQALYTCPHCPKTFNSNANMHSHRKKMHRPEWEELRRQKYNNQQKETNT